MVSTSPDPISSSGASINLQHRTNTWQVFNGAWQPLPALPPVAAGVWYRLRVTGTNWGVPAASYSIELSAAGGTNFTSAVTGLTAYQTASPDQQPGPLLRLHHPVRQQPGLRGGPGASGGDQHPGRPSARRRAQHQRHLPAPHGLQRGGRDRDGRGGAVGGPAVVRHLPAARRGRRHGQAVDHRHQPHAGRAPGERGRHPRQPDDPSRDAAAQHRALPGGCHRRGARHPARDPARPADRHGAASHQTRRTRSSSRPWRKGSTRWM
jgi:hypothetical protein